MSFRDELIKGIASKAEDIEFYKKRIREIASTDSSTFEADIRYYLDKIHDATVEKQMLELTLRMLDRNTPT